MDKLKKNNIWESFEIKVIIIVLGVILAAFLVFYVSVSNQYYNIIIDNLSSNATVVHNYVDDMINARSFKELNTIEDEEKESYQMIYTELDKIRRIANLRYLYTAKLNDDGEYIYVIDGLNQDAEDFRHIGSPIEEEIIPELEKCLNNEIVLSDKILNTDWGAVYVAYFPVHDKRGMVIGAIGMEFDAQNLYNHYNNIQKFAFAISILIISMFSILATILIRRASHPFYKTLAYIDLMTGLHNRTAFEVKLKDSDKDLASNNLIGIIICDLNYLKHVNDKLGHSLGDCYIKETAQFIDRIFCELGKSFRIGGDEFAVLTEGHSYEEISYIIENNYKKAPYVFRCDTKPIEASLFSVAFGFAVFDPQLDHDLNDTFKRADNNMYQFKTLMKSENQEIGKELLTLVENPSAL